MGALWIRALGPLEVVADGMPVAVRAGKQRIVLACLALRPNSLVTADFLAEAIWADHPPSHPLPQLQVYLANLRGMLEPGRARGTSSRHLPSRSGGYSLVVEEDELDLLQFRKLTAAGELAIRAGELAEGAGHLRHAVELFHGPAFPDLADVELVRPELEAIEELRMKAYQDLLDLDIVLGRESAAVGELRLLTSQYPYRERLWVSLVLALYRCGRRADALQAARSARKVFHHDLGLDPPSHLKELEVLILRQDASLDAAASGTAYRPRQRADNLPSAVTPMIGRETELGEVCSLYSAEGCRLVTVTGPGGAGKTRLALAVAEQLTPKMADGVAWVSLATLTQPRQVPAAVASSLGLADFAGEDPFKIASRFLKTRRMLLVLDNFEHLEDAWTVVLDMLTFAPDLRILATSRRRLGLRPEYEYELPPLATPPLDPILPPDLLREVPAVKLMLTRGRAVRRHFAVDDSNAAVLSRLCHRLDGLPLAIELAAAQLRHCSEAALLDDLEASLTGLPGAFRDVPDRQRTLAATLNWSYQLLGEDERRLFDHLGAFAANPSVSAVLGTIGLESPGVNKGNGPITMLEQHSLIRCYTDPGGQQRVSMLHSIREFARRRLATRSDAAEVRARHARCYLGLAEKITAGLWGADQLQVLRRLQRDAPEFRVALLWCAGPEGDKDVGLALVGQLWHYWELTGDVNEQQRACVDLVNATPESSPALRAPALSGAATLAWVLGKGQLAADLHQRALDAFRSAGNLQGAAWSTMCLAVQAAQGGRPEHAERLAMEALASPQATDRTQVGALIILSRLAYYAADHHRSLELSRRCAELARPLGDRVLLAIVLTNLAEDIQEHGDPESAERLLYEAAEAAFELGAMGMLASIMESLASVYLATGRADPAVQLLAAAEAHRVDRGVTLDAPESQRVDSIIGKARAEAGSVRFGLAWAAGHRLTLAQAAHQLLNLAPKDIPVPEGKSEPQAWPEGSPPDARPWV